MSEKRKRFCKINFINGETMHFSFEPVHEDGSSSMGQAIRDLSQNNNLIFQLESKLVVVPMNNVKSIEVSPVPSRLPATIVKAEYMD